MKSKWRLHRLIGLGGTGAVYEAEHRNGDRVALKVMHADIAANADICTRFLREGYAANAVQHHAVVRVHDEDVDEDGCPFLVLELLSGTSLQTALDSTMGGLALHTVRACAITLLNVLTVAHKKGILHRDLKPSNLFLTCDGQIKVLDFGLAREARSDRGDSLTTWSGLTMGTPAFMSPEQARGRARALDARSDIWGCGATLFTLLSGEHVHVAATAHEQLGMAMIATPRSLRSAKPDLADETIRWIDRALEFDPDARWQSAGEMLSEMPHALASIGQGEDRLPANPLTMRARLADETPTLSGLGRNAPSAAKTRAWSKARRGFVRLTLITGLLSAVFVLFRRAPESPAERLAAPPHASASRASPSVKAPAATARAVEAEPDVPKPASSLVRISTARTPAPTRSTRPSERRPSFESLPLASARPKLDPLDSPELLDRR